MSDDEIPWEKNLDGLYWAKDTEKGEWYLKRADGKVHYVSKDDRNWNCAECNANVHAITRYHSIHDGPFALSGSGQVKTVKIPYCPNCDEPPSSNGAPIAPPGAGWA